MDRTHRHFDDQLEDLSARVLRLGGLVEEAIGSAVRALIDRDPDLAARVIAADVDVDRLELEIDGECLGMLALHQPMARDLRFITTAMKVTTDLERMADLAVNVAERTLELVEEPPFEPPADIAAMAVRAREMVRRVLDAFVRRDAGSARAVIAMDDDLDRRLERVFRNLVAVMREQPGTLTRALRLTFVAKAFERIGDQATNVAEQIVWMAEGRVVKHPGAAPPRPGEPGGEDGP